MSLQGISLDAFNATNHQKLTALSASTTSQRPASAANALQVGTAALRSRNAPMLWTTHDTLQQRSARLKMVSAFISDGNAQGAQRWSAAATEIAVLCAFTFFLLLVSCLYLFSCRSLPQTFAAGAAAFLVKEKLQPLQQQQQQQQQHQQIKRPASASNVNMSQSSSAAAPHPHLFRSDSLSGQQDALLRANVSNSKPLALFSTSVSVAEIDTPWSSADFDAAKADMLSLTQVCRGQSVCGAMFEPDYLLSAYSESVVTLLGWHTLTLRRSVLLQTMSMQWLRCCGG
jgi:hypothetical protein